MFSYHQRPHYVPGHYQGPQWFAERFNYGIDPNDQIDVNIDIWDTYNTRSEIEDTDFLTETLGSMDVLLVFAGLLSAVVTAFIVETYKLLQPDQSEITNQLLIALTRNEAASPETTGSNFTPPQYAVRVNAFFFASLFTALLSALAAMLLKQWISYYTQGLKRISSKQIRARTRQFRYDAVRRWKLGGVVALVPVILHLSLFLFFVGLIDLLFSINPKVAGIAIALVACTGVFYVFTNLATLVSESAPFHSPIAEGFRNLAYHVRRWILLSHSRHMTPRDEEKAGDEAVENPADLTFRSDEPQAVLIRQTRTLDVDVVIQLMEDADKTTEAYIINQCFEKLMTFNFIASKNPSTFFRPSIPRIFHQMSDTCVTKDRQKLLRGRVDEAILLCRFLDWYLSMQQTAQEKEWLGRRFMRSETTMPRLLRDQGITNQDFQAILRGQTAYCRLQRLLQPDSGSCSVCLTDSSTVFEQIDKIADQTPNEASFSDALNRFMLLLTDCISNYLRDTTPGVDRASLVSKIIEQAKKLVAKTGANPTCYQPILNHLSRQNYADNPLAEQWKTSLIDTIKESARPDLFSPDGEWLPPPRAPRPPSPPFFQRVEPWPNEEEPDFRPLRRSSSVERDIIIPSVGPRIEDRYEQSPMVPLSPHHRRTYYMPPHQGHALFYPRPRRM
ncbi:SubName: Full=Uncharacterized protein {ECO:0000313/EMBL:CCA74490.1} [Serendipita indica DSM 11827]|nr:SubName: Full=Uncharacterized protein {ECO:0000313/EMBL:CCA74490.1} [Serendipita indica DSM 11827]